MSSYYSITISAYIALFRQWHTGLYVGSIIGEPLCQRKASSTTVYSCDMSSRRY